tara:strand:+ start:648 stop:1142 length:495 start_codon:yes stop_codon:yes gene_type:complete
LKKFIYIPFLLIINSCGFYTFSGASISNEVKNIKINYFVNEAENFKANLDRDITQKLTDIIIDQTNIGINNDNYEIEINGKIISYDVSPISISSNDIANQNRLSISVNIDFKNYIYEKENYNQKFTRYVDYKSDQNLEEIENELIDQILEEICIDIFNKTFVNW